MVLNHLEFYLGERLSKEQDPVLDPNRVIDILLVDAIDKNDLPKNMDIQFNFDSILMDSEKKKISLAKTCLEKLEKIT